MPNERDTAPTTCGTCWMCVPIECDDRRASYGNCGLDERQILLDNPVCAYIRAALLLRDEKCA